MAADCLRKLFEDYKKAVVHNPQLVSQLELGFRVASYLIAGRFHDSQVLSELFYATSNLIVMLNDAILHKKACVIPKMKVSQKRLMRIITVLEYVEVFIEMTAQRFWGHTGRWVAIAAIQVAKAVARFVLLNYYNAGIQPVPPIMPLNRQLLVTEKKTEEPVQETSESTEDRNSFHIPFTFTLKRSGKTMRSLAKTPQLSLRDWRLPGSGAPPASGLKSRENICPTPLTVNQYWGETLHIMKPLVHLTSLYLFGLSSWKPWLLSGAMDVSSLCLMGDPKDLNINEQGELRRRTLMLLLYLLRSPFYDRYSQAKIVMALKLLADNVPGMSLVMRPLMEYLPQWQKVYFYIWST
ncbi:peroxisomal membrane protein PEX16-like [Pomacea canaliculata]|uniref:peroxisomal membrane protein PEX16-like n=1 Tax=Pomacea canaliculata TaxID=400727 RepID=UPI000D73F746|nr:peroxisomal membrane protein PEX16-like [Pomacea canaliculata]